MTTTVTFELLQLAGEFTTNTHVPGDQFAPDVTGLKSGGFVSAYNSGSLAGGQVFVDFYDRNHEAIGAARTPAPASPATSAAGQPTVTELSNGNVLVAWDEDANSDNGAGIKGRIYSAAGAEVSDLLTLSETAFTDTLDPKVAALANGGFVVAYEGGDSNGVLSRVYDNAGVLIQGSVPADITVSTSDGQVAGLAGGGYAVAWTDTSGPQAVINARIYDDEGGSQTDVIAVGVAGQNTQSSITALADGSFAVVYTDSGWGKSEFASTGISMQIIDANGADVTPGGAPIHVNTPSSVSEVAPDVTQLANGFIAVSWSMPTRQHGTDIYARIFTANGLEVNVDGSNGPLVITGSHGEDTASAIASLLGGDFITSWQDSDTLDGSGGQITSKIEALVRVVVGDDANDLFIGDLLRDSVDGGGGDDTLYAFGNADTLAGGSGVDIVVGHTGRDVLEGGSGSDSVDGNEGNDIIYGVSQADPSGSVDHDVLTGDEGNDRITGSAGGDTVDGGSGDDRCAAGGGDDLLQGVDGDDRLDAGAGDDTVLGGAGGDTAHGGDGADLVYANSFVDHSGPAGGDTLFGDGGDDTISGSDGADKLTGGAGEDLILGLGGADQMRGSGGADTFLFTNAGESTTAAPDVILDLHNQDTVELSPMDANAGLAGNQAFVQVAQFSHTAGELLVQYHAAGALAGYTSIEGDQDGDGAADFTILAAGDHHAFSHFVL